MIDYRLIRPQDKLQWLPLWNAYLAFYECDLDETITHLTWQRFHDEREPLYCLAAYEANTMVGFATWVLHWSTWAVTNYCYLEDLFVATTHRGQGVARQLVLGVRNKAQAQHCDRVYWTTRESNATARALYDTVAEKTDFIQYRMR